MKKILNTPHNNKDLLCISKVRRGEVSSRETQYAMHETFVVHLHRIFGIVL